jgi:hypothetical protein
MTPKKPTKTSTKKDDPYGLEAIFRVLPYEKAVLKVWGRLQREALTADAAFSTLDAATRRWARRPDHKAMKGLLVAALEREDELLAYIALYAAQRWPPSGVLAEARVAVAGAVLIYADTAPHKASAVWLALWPLVIEGLQAGGVPKTRDELLATAEGSYASALCSHADDTVRLAGEDQFRAHVSRLREQHRAAPPGDHRNSLEFLLGRALANLGQILTDRHTSGARPGALEEALACHDEAMGLPARMGERGSRYHSLRMRATTRKLLADAQYDTQSARAIELIDGALEDVNLAVELARKYNDVLQIDGPRILRNLVNARLEWIRLHHRHGDLNPGVAMELITDSELLMDSLRQSGSRHHREGVAETTLGLREVRALLSGEAHQPTADDVERLLQEAIDSIGRPGAHGVDGARLGRLFDTILDICAGDADRLPAPLWPLFALLLGHLEPEEVGLVGLAQAIDIEVALLHREDGRPREGWDPIQHVQEATRSLEGRLNEPTATNAERRLYAGWMRRVAEIRMRWSRGPEASPLSHEEILELAERCGSAAWRSDLAYFGAGVVAPGYRHEEHGWRFGLYRIRAMRDLASQVLAGDELMALIAEESPEQAEALAAVCGPVPFANVLHPDTPPDEVRRRSEGRRAIQTPDGVMVWELLTPALAQEQLARTALDLRAWLRAGEERGWRPAVEGATPQTDGAEVLGWLANNPKVALLVFDLDVMHLWLNDEGAPRPVVFKPEAKVVEALTAAFEAYLKARAKFGAPEEASSPGEAPPSFDQALQSLLATLGEALSPLFDEALYAGARQLLVLARDWARHVPWGALQLEQGLLGELLPVTLIESLATPTRAARRVGPTSLVIGGAGVAGSALRAGRACLTQRANVVVAGPTRAEFEELARTSSVLRVLAHGHFVNFYTDTGGILLNEDRSATDAAFSRQELRALDLRGVRRVELWSCDSGREDDWLVGHFHHDEPSGLDGALLLAGCEVVISALWKQDSLSAAMIAEAFAVLMTRSPGRPEANRLAAAVAKYRLAMLSGGVFCEALMRRLREGRCSDQQALEAGLDAWRAELGATTAIQPGALVLGATEVHRSTRGSPQDRAEALLDGLRSPVAWAGWKVTLRSKEALWPSGG